MNEHPAPKKFTISYGITQNLGDFNSRRIDLQREFDEDQRAEDAEAQYLAAFAEVRAEVLLMAESRAAPKPPTSPPQAQPAPARPTAPAKAPAPSAAPSKAAPDGNLPETVQDMRDRIANEDGAAWGAVVKHLNITTKGKIDASAAKTFASIEAYGVKQAYLLWRNDHPLPVDSTATSIEDELDAAAHWRPA